jgi:hypothetical protein
MKRFAPLLNPMSQSLIYTKDKSSTFPTVLFPAAPAFIAAQKNFEVGMPLT